MANTLNNNCVKLLALLFMLIDHVGVVFLVPGSIQYCATRFIGRLSFPLYAYLAAEGIEHTSNRPQYAIRLMCLAFISEIPYDLAWTGHLYASETQNVFFTMSFSVLAFCFPSRGMQGRIAWVLIAGLLAKALRSDYGFSGVILISAFYFFRERKDLTAAITAAFFYTPVGFLGHDEMMSTLDVLLLSGTWMLIVVASNGTNGNKKWRHLFYSAYPVHLFCYWAMKRFIIG